LSLLEFAVLVMAVSLPRVISPSPLFVAALGYGIKDGWRAGLKVAYGHTVVALPLAILLGVGALSLATLPHFSDAISLLGAASLFAFATFQFQKITQKTAIMYPSRQSPFFVGIFMTALNPFFLAWWFMVGLKLISDSLILYSVMGFVVMFTSHIWMDYSWLAFVGFLSGRGKNVLAFRNYKIFKFVLTCLFIFFGIEFLLQVALIKNIF
jgi:threonine/homoserine/homoserine lactone efflux protein